MQEQPDPRILRYLKYCSLRLNGRSGDEVASELGAGSSEALYRSLRRDGFPVCVVCGETPAEPNHCQKRDKRRKARGETGSSMLKLPPAREAIPLFEKVVGSPDALFGGGLHQLCEDLQHLEEEFDGKCFASNLIFGNEAGFEGTLRREDFSDKEWSELCEGLSQDPQITDEITPYDGPWGPGISMLGIHKTPAEQLVVLIAVYALTRRNLDPLIDSLHPDPSFLDREQLESVRQELRLAAEHMATIVRGGKVGRGAPVEGLSRKETFLACRITELKNRGLSYAMIHEQFYEYGEQIFRGEVERLGSLGLQFPDY